MGGRGRRKKGGKVEGRRKGRGREEVLLKNYLSFPFICSCLKAQVKNNITLRPFVSRKKGTDLFKADKSDIEGEGRKGRKMGRNKESENDRKRGRG